MSNLYVWIKDGRQRLSMVRIRIHIKYIWEYVRSIRKVDRRLEKAFGLTTYVCLCCIMVSCQRRLNQLLVIMSHTNCYYRFNYSIDLL